MSEKDSDNKGQILKTGESQRDGRYLLQIYMRFIWEPVCYSLGFYWLDQYQAGRKRDCISARKITSYKTFMSGSDVVGKTAICNFCAEQNSSKIKV